MPRISREIARRQRAGDRLGGVPPFQCVGGAPGVFLGVARLRSRDDRAVPIVDDVERLVVFEALDLHQPVDMIAPGAAAETIIVIGVDPHARLCFAVERAQDHAVARHRAVDQVGEIDLGVVERRLPGRAGAGGGAGGDRGPGWHSSGMAIAGLGGIDDRGLERNVIAGLAPLSGAVGAGLIGAASPVSSSQLNARRRPRSCRT